MKQIVNNLIPFKGYKAMCLWPFIFVRKGATYSKIDDNHERIHAEQQKELLVVFFYLVYLFEWLFRVLFTKDRFSYHAYKYVSFEKEAYSHQAEQGYLEKRKHFAQWRKI